MFYLCGPFCCKWRSKGQNLGSGGACAQKSFDAWQKYHCFAILLNILTSPVIHWSLRSRPILSFKKTTRSFCLNQRLTRGHSLHSSGWNCRDGPSRGHHRVPVISLEVGDKLGDFIFFIYVDASYVVFLQKTLQTGKKTRWIFQTWGQFLPYGIFFSCFYVSADCFFAEIQELRIENTCFFFREKKNSIGETRKSSSTKNPRENSFSLI